MIPAQPGHPPSLLVGGKAVPIPDAPAAPKTGEATERMFPEESSAEAVFQEWSRPGGRLAGKTRAILTSPEVAAINAEAAARQKRVKDQTLEFKTQDVDIKQLSEAVANGQESADQIRGSMGIPMVAKIKTAVLQKYPKFNFTYSDANSRWTRSTTNQRTISMIEGSLPRVTMLDDQLQQLPNADFPAINAVMRQASIQTGKPAFVDFESNRNAIVQEINTALSGSATGSDFRVKIELENLNTSRSPAQLRAAIGNLREALLARLEPSMSPLYPIEVVRGEKTMEQYLNEVRKKHRGKAQESGGVVSSGKYKTLSNEELLKQLQQ
jgi:hypothetical protein